MSPECGAPVRGFPGESCRLAPGHRGHHSCSTATCEQCGKVRRASQVQRYAYGYGYGTDESIDVCWWCSHGPESRQGW